MRKLIKQLFLADVARIDLSYQDDVHMFECSFEDNDGVVYQLFFKYKTRFDHISREYRLQTIWSVEAVNIEIDEDELLFIDVEVLKLQPVQDLYRDNTTFVQTIEEGPPLQPGGRPSLIRKSVRVSVSKDDIERELIEQLDELTEDEDKVVTMCRSKGYRSLPSLPTCSIVRQRRFPPFASNS